MNPSIRVGDNIKVITPERFIRCGYSLTPQMMVEELVDNHSGQILSLLKSLGIESTQFLKYGMLETTAKINPNKKGISRLLSALGYLMVNARGFGGRDRTIFTEPFDHLNEATYKVTATRQVMTGKYYGPAGGYAAAGYDGGEHWYETGGLEDMKSNKILRVDIDNTNWLITVPDPYNGDTTWNGIWIPAEYCEKIEGI